MRGFQAGWVFVILLAISSHAQANIFKTALEFWTSEEISYLFKKNVLRRTPEREKQKSLEALLSQFKAKGLPTGFIRKALPYLDLVIQVEEFNGEDSSDGRVAYMMYERRLGVSGLKVPSVFFDSKGKFVSLSQMDPTMMAKLYHEMFHVYLDRYAPANLNEPISIIHGVLANQLRRTYPKLSVENADDVADEMLSVDVEYIVNDYLTVRASLERRLAAGKPFSPEYLQRLGKMWHPLEIQSWGYSNDPKVEFETRMTIPAKLQRRLLETAFEGRFTGDLKADFKEFGL